MSARLLIADSGPLIALARLDLLHLPGHYFAETLVTATIWQEVLRKPRGDEEPRLRQAVAAGSLRLVDDPPLPAVESLAMLRDPGIGAGERSVILCASDMDAAVLIDDLRARRAAHKLTLPCIGTVGLLARGRMSGLLGPLRPLLEELAASGYFLSDKVMRQVLSALGEA